MSKPFLSAWVVVFILWMLGDFLVHGVLLHADYAGLPSLFRTDADSQQYLPFIIIAHVVLAGAFTWIYARGQEARPWLPQGLRFGLAVALLTVVPTYTIYYVVQPMPGVTVVKQIIFDSIVILLAGVVVGFMYRGKHLHADSR